MAKRFAAHSNDELEVKKRTLTNKNTIKSNTKAANAFRDYLKEKGSQITFEEFTDDGLDEELAKFYFDARSTKGDLYKVSSLENLRHGLNRYLKAPPFNKNIDIVHGESFHKSRENFKLALRELKQSGKGCVDHHPRIPDAELATVYNSKYLNQGTPEGLQNKVQFDVRFYFARRGAENMHGMTKSTYEIVTDTDTGKRYVAQKVDELNKNHNESDKERYTGYMPEMPGEMCPVASFETMLARLHPSCDRLWQKPKACKYDGENVWYFKRPIGIHTLAKFMPTLSTLCNLSQIYHNHSIRVTGATILTQNKFSMAQIMAVTGHKSRNSQFITVFLMQRNSIWEPVWAVLCRHLPLFQQPTTLHLQVLQLTVTLTWTSAMRC